MLYLITNIQKDILVIFYLIAFVETSSTPSQWRVFLLCEPADHLPVGLLLFAHQLAWDVVQREGPVYQALDSTDLDLKSLITSTLEV